jgi:hypothetical protein
MSELDKDIREEHRKHGSLFKTAKKMGTTIDYVIGIVGNEKVEEQPDASTCKFDGFGDPAKHKFFVGRSLAKDVWDNSRPEIADARAKFEAGTHNMGTGRDGPWVILYLFPQAVVTPRPNYFTPTLEG